MVLLNFSSRLVDINGSNVPITVAIKVDKKAKRKAPDKISTVGDHSLNINEMLGRSFP